MTSFGDASVCRPEFAASLNEWPIDQGCLRVSQGAWPLGSSFVVVLYR